MSGRAFFTWGGAIGAHVVLALVLPRAHVAPLPVAPPVEELSVDLAPTATTTEAIAPSDVATAVAAAGATAQPRSYQLGTTSTAGATDLPQTGVIEPAPTASQGGAVPFGGLLVVPGGDKAAIGLGGGNSYRTQTALAGGAGSSEPTAKQRFDSALNSALQQRERELGMLQEGPAILALEDATRASAGPLEGRAVLALTFDASGVCTGASVESSSSDRATWNDIAKKAVAALAQKHVRVPSGARGLELRIEVESKMALPSGARAPISGVGLKSDDKGNAGLGANFDVSDIGSKPSRVVGARTIGSSTL